MYYRIVREREDGVLEEVKGQEQDKRHAVIIQEPTDLLLFDILQELRRIKKFVLTMVELSGIKVVQVQSKKEEGEKGKASDGPSDGRGNPSGG